MLIPQLLAFLAVISFALAPRMAWPAIRFALLVYAVGVGP
jgi:hypothetical protein